ncbi:MAG: GNAT family N-acetyltransferase [Oscillospiraceae bacterium]|nr:GNAT family N-acetyltransferase [Oscillospiraceae bacterium]
MNIIIRPVVIEDYDGIYALWNSTEQTRRAMNPVDDSREGIERYLKRNPTTCFLAYLNDGTEGKEEIVGVILTGHDGRRAIIHHMCVHPDHRRHGIARTLVQKAEDALRKEGITKVFGLVFKDNDTANSFWEEQGYTLRTNLNYRNKSLNENVPQGE